MTPGLGSVQELREALRDVLATLDDVLQSARAGTKPNWDQVRFYLAHGQAVLSTLSGEANERQRALEEAAKVADDFGASVKGDLLYPTEHAHRRGMKDGAKEIARAIRALSGGKERARDSHSIPRSALLEKAGQGKEQQAPKSTCSVCGDIHDEQAGDKTAILKGAGSSSVSLASPAFLSPGKPEPSLPTRRFRCLKCDVVGDSLTQPCENCGGTVKEIVRERVSGNPQGTPEPDAIWWRRMEYIFREAPFPWRHRWGGDAREFIQGVDIALSGRSEQGDRT